MSELSHPHREHAPPRRTPATPRLAGLDGARGIACLAVISAHTSVHFTPQAMARAHLDLVLGHGVTFFFVLSAFLLYLPYVRRFVAGRDMPATSVYLRRRVFRIFPAYLVIFLICNFVLRAVYLQNPFTVGWGSDGSGIGMMTDPLQLLANLTLTQTLFPAFLQTGINPSWTLTVEWGFYLVLPLMGLLLFRCARHSRRPLLMASVPAAVLFAVGIATQVVVQILQQTHYPDAVLEGFWGSNWTAVLSRSSLAFATTFAIGMGAAVMYVALGEGTLRGVRTIHLQWISAVCAVAAGIGAVAMFTVNPHYVETLVGFFAGAVILLIGSALSRAEHSAAAVVTDWRPLRGYGVMALSAYLWHYPVLILVSRSALEFPDSAIGMISAFVVVATGAGLLGWITYRFIEKPAMRLGR